MKKLTATLVSLILLSIATLPVAAQTRGRVVTRSTYNEQSIRRYEQRARANRIPSNNAQVYGYPGAVSTYDGYYYDPYNTDPYYGQDRSVWEKHRDKITTAGGAVGGALIGGLLGGKKGAVVGAIAGGAGAAVYTYKIRDRYRRY